MGRMIASAAAGAAVLVIIGAALVGPYPAEQRAAMLAGSIAVLLLLAGVLRRR